MRNITQTEITKKEKMCFHDFERVKFFFAFD